MAHEILIATFPTTVPTVGTTGIDARRPYFNMKNVQLDNPSLSYISIEDDEERYDYLSAASGNRIETMQNPTVPLDFGGANGTVAVTESMSATSGSIVVDSAGNRFVMMWPAKYNLETALTQEIGNRMVLLIFPVGVAQSDGTTFWPTFDPTRTISYSSSYGASISNPVLYGPQRAPCFTPGTLIETEHGMRKVEDLAVGDRILTRDDGFQPLRWIGSKHLTPHRLDLQPNLRPIRIAAGALGRGCPAADLVVSPQHRVLVRSDIAKRMFGTEEVLVAAKHLLDLEGVALADAAGEGVTYLHLLFDDHQILRSNGAWTESLFVGPETLNALPPAARREIAALFPELVTGILPTPSRKLLSGKEGRQLTFRHTKNRRAMAPER